MRESGTNDGAPVCIRAGTQWTPCRTCNREIAAFQARDDDGRCLYCALDLIAEKVEAGKPLRADHARILHREFEDTLAALDRESSFHAECRAYDRLVTGGTDRV